MPRIAKRPRKSVVCEIALAKLHLTDVEMEFWTKHDTHGANSGTNLISKCRPANEQVLVQIFATTRIQRFHNSSTFNIIVFKFFLFDVKFFYQGELGGRGFGVLIHPFGDDFSFNLRGRI